MTKTSTIQTGDIDIELTPVTLPAFGGRKGHWSDYQKIAEDGICEITVTPALQYRILDTDLVVIDVDCHFDSSAYDTATYGLVYGDGQFEEAIEAHVLRVLGVPEHAEAGICFTEQGMQTDHYISLEGNDALRAFIGNLSNHAFLALTRNAEISSITTDSFQWEATQGPGSSDGTLAEPAIP